MNSDQSDLLSDHNHDGVDNCALCDALTKVEQEGVPRVTGLSETTSRSVKVHKRNSVKVTTCTVVAHGGSIRLTVTPIRRGSEPRPAPIVLDFHPTDAAGVGCVLKAMADEMRNRAGSVERMQADRDALDAALNILHRPLDNA